MTFQEDIAQLKELSAKIHGCLPKPRPARWRVLTKAQAFGSAKAEASGGKKPPWMTDEKAREPSLMVSDELEPPTDEERSRDEAELTRARQEIPPLLNTWREVFNKLDPQLSAAIGTLTARQEREARTVQMGRDALRRYEEYDLLLLEKNLKAGKPWALSAMPLFSEDAMTALERLELGEQAAGAGNDKAPQRLSSLELERCGKNLLKAERTITIRLFAKRLSLPQTTARRLECWINRPHKNHGGRKPRIGTMKPEALEAVGVDVDKATQDTETLDVLIDQQAADDQSKHVKID